MPESSTSGCHCVSVLFPWPEDHTVTSSSDHTVTSSGSVIWNWESERPPPASPPPSAGLGARQEEHSHRK